MASIKVKNKNKTANKTPPSPHKSWLEFWESEKKKKAKSCHALPCSGRADVGGHVIKSGEGAKEYILPLCHACNNRPDGEEFQASEDNLASVK